MLHHTWSTHSDEAQARDLQINSRQVSAHYLVGRNGQLYQFAEPDQITRHTGKGSLDWIVNTMNNYAIWIEIASDGYNFTDYQRASVVRLIRKLLKIKEMKIIRHSDYSSTGKRDVWPNFYHNNWQRLMDKINQNNDWLKKLIQAKIDLNSWIRHSTEDQKLKDKLHEENNHWRDILEKL